MKAVENPKNKQIGVRFDLYNYSLIGLRASVLKKNVTDYVTDLIMSDITGKQQTILEHGGSLPDIEGYKKQITTLQEQLKTAQAIPKQNDGLEKEYADYKKQSQKVIEEAIRQEKEYQKQIATLTEENKRLKRFELENRDLFDKELQQSKVMQQEETIKSQASTSISRKKQIDIMREVISKECTQEQIDILNNTLIKNKEIGNIEKVK